MEMPGELQRIKILYVEDDFIVRFSIAKFLSRRCKEVIEAKNGLQGLELYKQHKPDIVVTDIEMPVMDGLEMIDKILQMNTAQPIIITTGYDDEQHQSERVCVNIIKPIDDNELLEAIVKCINDREVKNK